MARRKMWSIIESVSASRSIVLVSHSMEECEALCTRVAILVGGRFKCCGSSQHIKSKFGAGYSIEMRCSSHNYVVEATKALQHTVGTVATSDIIDDSNQGGTEVKVEQKQTDGDNGIIVDELHGSFVRLHAPSNLDLAATFSFFEASKAEYHVLDYSVSQATLESVFVKFASEQEEEVGLRHISGFVNLGEGGPGDVVKEDNEGEVKEDGAKEKE